MNAEREEKPIKVQIVEERRAPIHVVGIPRTYTPLTLATLQAAGAIPESILPFSMRRSRALISIVGTGVVVFGTNPADIMNGAGTRAAGAYVQGPALFELNGTNEWYIALASGAATTVSVVSENEMDV